MNQYKTAKSGNLFILTEKGYAATPDGVKPERKIGKPVSRLFVDRVPASWIAAGWVREVRAGIF